MLDRSRQKSMLEDLAACYPNHSATVIVEDDMNDIANLYYLREHGLIEASLDRTLSGAFVFGGASITAKGLDFLADDGGLSSILGTVTVKLHADSIKELIASRIDSSDLPDVEKSWLKEQIDMMSSESLKTITKALVEQGLSKIPDLFVWIRSII